MESHEAAICIVLLLLLLLVLATAAVYILYIRKDNEKLKRDNLELKKQLYEEENLHQPGPISPSTKTSRSRTDTSRSRGSSRRKRAAKKKISDLQRISPIIAFAMDENARVNQRDDRLFTGGTPLNSDEDKTTPTPVIKKRSIAERIARNFTPAEFAEAMQHTVDFINEYTENPGVYTVTTKLKPWSLVGALPKTAPLYPENYQDVLGDVKNFLLPMMTHWQHPRFHAYFPHGRNHADMLAAALEMSFAVVGFSYDSCPALTELEVITTNWLADCFGLPKGFSWNVENVPGSSGGGFYLPSASDGVFASIMAARDWKFERILKKFHEGRLDKRVNVDSHRSQKHDLRHEICQRMVVYASKDAHSCLELACKMAMVRCHPIQATAANDWGITGAQLEEAIQQDLDAGLVPFHVHVTLGTTSTASCDHLKTIWPVARKYKLWLHVDAAYAGGTWVDPKYRAHAEGLEHVTTININLNKFFMHVSPGSILWTQDKDTFKKGFSLTPPYLKPLKNDTMDLRHYGVQLTRTFRSLRTWILMRTTGVEGLRYYVNRMIDFTAYFEHLIKQHPNVRPFCKRNYGLFCFYFYEPNMPFEECNAATRTLAGYINDTHELFITRSNVAGQEIIRISVNYINTTMQTIEKNVEILKDIMDKFRSHWAVFKHSLPAPAQPLEGRNAYLGPALYDIDLRGAPLPEVDPATVERWAETPDPITRQKSVKETYRLPKSPTSDVDVNDKALSDIAAATNMDRTKEGGATYGVPQRALPRHRSRSSSSPALSPGTSKVESTTTISTAVPPISTVMETGKSPQVSSTTSSSNTQPPAASPPSTGK